MNHTIISTLLLVAAALQQNTAHAMTFDNNVPQDIQAQMLSDLAFMQGIQGTDTSPMHQKIYGQMDGPSYTNWFYGRVKAVGMNACGGGNAVACVIPMFNSSKMWLTQNFIKFQHPAIARLMVVYHEARHTERENGNWGHATCPKPFLDAAGNEMRSIWTGASLGGEAACDVTPYGSYGSSTILLKNISRYCANCAEKVKMDSGIYANDQINRITNAQAKTDMIKDVFTRNSPRFRNRN